MKSYRYKINGSDYNVDIELVDGNQAKVSVNGTSYDVELDKPISRTHLEPRHQKVAHIEASPARKERIPAPDEAKPVEVPTEGVIVRAPLPGTITSIAVNVGDKVSEGDVLVVLEAMKMNNNIEAESAGTICRIDVHPGDAVKEGAILVVIV